MKRGTLTKFAELCEYHDWPNALVELAKMPGCDKLEEAVGKLHAVMAAERQLAEARRIAKGAAE